ncbi:MAG: deaminase [Desulfurococcales archaeon]|nr:deaminase [Desulfurococcales archaeon]
MFTEQAPKPVGPYSQGVIAGDYLFVSGQIPIDPATGELVKEPFSKASEVALRNVIAVVKAAGGDVNSIVKVTVYMKDINKFSEFNEVYSRIFGEHKPARAVIGVAALPKGVDLEVEAIAYLGK